MDESTNTAGVANGGQESVPEPILPGDSSHEPTWPNDALESAPPQQPAMPQQPTPMQQEAAPQQPAMPQQPEIDAAVMQPASGQAVAAVPMPTQTGSQAAPSVATPPQPGTPQPTVPQPAQPGAQFAAAPQPIASPAQQTAAVPGQKGEPFYKKTWFVILMALLLPPVGIVLAWVFKKPAGKGGRIAVTVVAVLLMLFGLAGGDGSTEESNGSADNSGSEPVAEQPTSSTSDESSATEEAAKPEAPEEPAPTLESITASYSGSTEEGTVVDGSSGFEVEGTYSDGSTKSITDFTVAEPVTLAAEQTSTVTVEAEGVSTTVDITCTTVSKETYKSQCTPVDYETLARDPDSWVGQSIVVTGQVIQVQEDSSGAIYRVDITQNEYGYWEDTILMLAEPGACDTRILEDDIVTIYGTSTGLYTYETVLGASMTVPSMIATYIEMG